MKNASIDKVTVLEELDAILASDEFAHLAKYQELLRYLVNASINDEEIKQSTIAFDIFGKDATFDPAIDSSIRAYMSNLRKKLEHYYLTEGKGRDVILSLPRGHYDIKFEKASNAVESERAYAFFHKYYSPIVIILLITIIALLYTNNSQQEASGGFIPKDDPIWGDFFSSTEKTLFVIGDYYFFEMPIHSGRLSYIRDVQINSDDDLDAFLNENPALKDKIKKTYHTFLDEHIPACLLNIIPSFVYHQISQPELKLATELDLNDLHNRNIIYIGPYKSLNILKPFTSNFLFDYQNIVGRSEIRFFSPDSSKFLTYIWKTNLETMARTDYPTVVKISGQSANTILLFLSQHDFGNLATVKYFTDPANLKVLNKSIPYSYFSALFKVSGIRRTDFKMDLLHVNQLQQKFNIGLD